MAILSITVPDPAVPRVQAAFGKLLALVDGNGDPRDATADEVRQFLVDTLKANVRVQEERDAVETAIGGITEVGATL